MLDCSAKWLRTGDEAFAAMLTAIGGARASVRLETYIFAGTGIGERFRAALIEACRRGAVVRVLVDAWGSFSLLDGFWTPVREAGGEVRWFNPLGLKRATFRDHRKLLVCDDQVAFVGGTNLAPDYEGDGVSRGWRDLSLRIGGRLVADLAASFDALFARADLQHRPFTRLRRSWSRQVLSQGADQILLGGPGRGRSPIIRALVADLDQAARVRIIVAYFLPTRVIRRALIRVARRGGSVELILPAKTDVQLARLASHRFYQVLLRAGVRLYEYEPQILHTKLIVVDGAGYAGSANLDPRSLHINYELLLRFTAPALVAEATAIFEDHRRLSRPIELAAWRTSRSLWNRLRERWACFILARLDPLIMRQQWRHLRP